MKTMKTKSLELMDRLCIKFSKQIVNINAYPYLISQNKATGKYGLIDTDGNAIAEEIYNDITPEYFGKKGIYLSYKKW